ncbi:MAG: SUF system NifU family Fe-S cluster assembly protein [Nanoarchaeota archaeon]|nr:SUF system NifU family Fe-S cluster assembly protein [Nanoarchaeota archaeon]
MTDELYKEVILDHYKHPHNKGKLENATVKQTEQNPICGDVVTIYLNIADNVITDISFNGCGCAISTAAASLLTDHLKGKTIEEAQNLSRDDMVSLLTVSISPARTKCAMLALVAVKNGTAGLR